MDSLLPGEILNFYPPDLVGSAESLLEKMFLSISKLPAYSDNINVIVIGAGTFPSFSSFVYVIRKYFPNVKEVNFSLVDPDTYATSIFEEYAKKFTPILKEVKINILKYNLDIKKYLENSTKKYDLVYFERPDSSIFNFLFSYITPSSSRLALSMQESLPYLVNILKINSLIIGSFIYKDDLKHLNHLLKYSLGIKPSLFRNRAIITKIFYNYGLIGVVNPSSLLGKLPEKQNFKIRLYRLYYYYVLLFSIIAFLITPVEIKIISFFFVILQLFYHRYGIKGAAVKLLLLIAQNLLIL